MNNLLQAFIPLALAALTLPAAPSGYILDEADLLSAVTEAALETRLGTLEEETSTEFVIATVDSLQGYPIEDYALELGREWGVGQEEFDNGLILLVAPTERELRIEVGYGLEGAITDAQSSSIINQVMTPQFAVGSYEEGILAGVDYLEKMARGEVFDLPSEPEPAANASIFLFALVFILPLLHLFAATLSQSKAWWPGGLIGAALAGIFFFSISATVIGLLIGLVLDFILSRFFYQKINLKSKGGPGGFWWGGGSGGFGGGGGGFGGGSFGGGGASGRW